MQTLITQYSTLLLLAGFLIILFALRKTIRYANQSRRAPYYILREEATRSAQRWALLSILFVALTVAVAVIALQTPPALAPGPSVTATVATVATVPTIGPAPTLTSTSTRVPPTTTPTVTPTLTSTATPAPDVPFVLLTPIPNAATPAPQARFEFLTLASRIDANFNPLDPGLQFPSGTSRVYVFFRASGVNNGAPWGIFCYRDGEIFDLFVTLWDDGPAAQTARAFCSHDGSPGTYRARAYIGTTLAFEEEYSLAGAPVPTQPQSGEATPVATP